MPEQTDVRKLEEALRKAGSPPGTRRWLLERAAVGAAGVAAGGALDPAGAALARGGHGSINAFGTVAVTTEALTVTLLTEVLRRANLNSVPAGDLAVFEGAYAAEVDHFRFTRKHWNPTTTNFWIPDGFFGGSASRCSRFSALRASKRRSRGPALGSARRAAPRERSTRSRIRSCPRRSRSTRTNPPKRSRHLAGPGRGLPV